MTSLVSHADPIGLNLVGYASAPLGLGAELRQMAEAFIRRKFPFRIVDIRLPDSAKAPDHLRPYVVDKPFYPASLFCMSPFGYMDLMRRCQMEYSHQYKIGNFFWELPDLPTKCQTIFDTVNEIWAATSFLKSVFENAGDCPVYLVPTPGASLRPCDGDLREILGIDQEAFVFGYMFDAQSSLARKNPHAVLAAYNIMRGMLPAATKVALLFKVHRITSSSISDFLRLRDLTEDQDGVFFLTASLSHNRLKRCFNTMDAYVSLHRSEGLGRTIIEAAQSGMPVLCTNYSGSADIVETGAVIGIDWRLSPVMSDAYSQNEPSCWAEPNVEQAARIMARVVQNPNYYRPTAAALDKLATRFSAESFVDVASRRLREADINSYINVGQ